MDYTLLLVHLVSEKSIYDHLLNKMITEFLLLARDYSTDFFFFQMFKEQFCPNGRAFENPVMRFG